MGIIKKLYHPDYMISEADRLGEMPDFKTAYKDVFRMAWPAIIETLLLSLCSMVDTMMVGVVGTNAITAIGLSGPPRSLILAAYTALNIAVTAIVARRTGEGDRKGANNTLKQALMLSLILSSIIVAPGLIFAEQLIRMCGAPESVVGDSIAYFSIWLSGIPIWAISTVINAANRACGRAAITMITNVTSNLINVVFNYLLIDGKFGFPALGVRGAAIATFICFAVQAVIALCSVINRNGRLYINFFERFRFDRDIFLSIRRVAPSYFFNQIVAFVGSLITVRIINSLGRDDAYASYQIVNTLYSLLVGVANGFSSAASALVGQSLGRKRPDIAVLDIKLCTVLAFLFSFVFILAYGIFGDYIVGFYVPDKEAGAAVLHSSTIMLRILAGGSFISIALVIFMGALQGAGDVKFIMVVAMISIGVIRPGCTYLFCNIPALGVIGSWIAVIVDEIFRMSMLYCRLKSGKWKTIRL